MTIARDIRTGAIVGQVTEARSPVRVTPSGEFVDATYAPRLSVTLLTRGGHYVTVPRSSVRLEEISDR